MDFIPPIPKEDPGESRKGALKELFFEALKIYKEKVILLRSADVLKFDVRTVEELHRHIPTSARKLVESADVLRFDVLTLTSALPNVELQHVKGGKIWLEVIQWQW